MHTVKILAAIFILLAVVVGFGIFTVSTLNNTANELNKHISKIETSITDKNWEKAANELSNFEDVWSGTSRTWAILLDHIEIDNIDNTLARLSTYVKVRNQSLALGEASALKLYVKHIPEKEQLKIKNIM